MAASWGVSRTMAEIHALLYLATEPLCTDDVMDRLAVSRGSASTNLRELVNWGLIQRVHRRGDRKEYFEAETDAWTMFGTITRERRRREIQPIVETIEKCLAMIDARPASSGGEANADVDSLSERLRDLQELFKMLNVLFNFMLKGSQKGMKPLLRQLSKLSG